MLNVADLVSLYNKSCATRLNKGLSKARVGSNSFKYMDKIHRILAIKHFNTQYIRNSDMVNVLKMEYVSKIDVFGLKMLVKRGLEKIFLKFLHA